jgi:S-adenosylmethionine hydrolase
VAAHLARGLAPARVGPALPLSRLTLLPAVTPRAEPDGIHGRVIHVDHFGNLITNITAGLLPRLGAPEALHVVVARYRLRGIHPTYMAAPVGAPVALINSAGLLEIAVRDGHAARDLGLGPGAPVICRPK